ncbi:hypothetical protein DOM21_14905 [Bacteriovorax stolpii]|uniref:VirB4 family type IV secretion system protein n=1 Tax=Bacteriovorax stolpii TaxID=960 RepID=UPI0011593CBB|nr:hypothetical protein [Bacteriovorax stolpii]QDK42716.1 hypothetical protein DOM21_14905 [Bacteriovorax stolpii]
MQKLKVYKVNPTDFDQMDLDEVARFFSEFRVSLNQIPIKKEEEGFKKASFFSSFLNERTKEDVFFYKFYSLNEELFLETNCEEVPSFSKIQLQELESGKVINDFVLGGETVLSNVILGDDYVKANSKYFRLINLYAFSKRLMPSELMDLGDYCLFFRRVDSQLSRKQVNTQRKLHHANLYSSMRNIESEASYKEAENLVESMMNGEEEIFEVEGWFILQADDLSQLGDKTRLLIRSLKQMELVPYIESEGLGELYPTIMSRGVPLFKRSHRPQSKYLANLIPLINEKIHEEGIEFYTRRSNSIFYKLFEESALNFNILLCGQSGAGKTMVAQKILSEELWKGTSAIVLDLGNSFRKTAAFFGGEILSQSFNPLQFRSSHYLKELIISVIPKEELSAKLEGKLFNLIVENLPSLTSFRELILRLSTEIPDLDLYFAELWEFFDDEVRSLSKFTYVDTSLYPDKIKAPLIIFLIEAFKHLEGRKIFAFDEVWSFLRNNSQYIEECFRTFRKHGGAALAITQAISDCEDGSLTKIIPRLCSTKFFFQQAVSDSEFLTEFDKEKIRSLSTKVKKYSEFYVKTDFHRKIVRYYPTPLEYELGTSNDLDRVSFERFYEKNEEFFEFPEIVKRFVDFKYYFGGLS